MCFGYSVYYSLTSGFLSQIICPFILNFLSDCLLFLKRNVKNTYLNWNCRFFPFSLESTTIRFTIYLGGKWPLRWVKILPSETQIETSQLCTVGRTLPYFLILSFFVVQKTERNLKKIHFQMIMHCVQRFNIGIIHSDNMMIFQIVDINGFVSSS